ncbi:MAG: sigma-70 family RNA polymerase sigma factor [Cyanobacteria bacterium J06632_3]
MSISHNPEETANRDAVLMQQIAQQDQVSLSQLYDRYARVVHALAYRLLGSREEAEEVVLDVFSQVWRTAKRYDPGKGRVDAWLFMLTRSRALDRGRKRQRDARVMESATAAEKADCFPKGPSPEDVLLSSDRRQQIKAALDQIPPEQRQIIELAYFQGLSQSQIVRQTGISLGTVKTRARLGLKKLRALLQEADL